MEQKKCTECGQILPEGVMYCPNCGCPVEASSEYVNVEQQQTVVSTPLENKSFPTTDTGDKYEKVLKSWADVIWYGSIVGVIILFIFLFILIEMKIDASKIDYIVGRISYNAHESYKFITHMYMFGYWIAAFLFLSFMYVVRAFIIVVHNISINVHEINMKTKPQE